MCFTGLMPSSRCAADSIVSSPVSGWEVPVLIGGAAGVSTGRMADGMSGGLANGSRDGAVLSVLCGVFAGRCPAMAVGFSGCLWLKAAGGVGWVIRDGGEGGTAAGLGAVALSLMPRPASLCRGATTRSLEGGDDGGWAMVAVRAAGVVLVALMPVLPWVRRASAN